MMGVLSEYCDCCGEPPLEPTKRDRIATLEAELREAREQVCALLDERDAAQARADAAEAETKELRDDWRRALKRAHDLTLETQTMEDTVTDLCRIVLQEREQKHAAEAEAQRLRECHTANVLELHRADAMIGDLRAQLAARDALLASCAETVTYLVSVIEHERPTPARDDDAESSSEFYLTENIAKARDLVRRAGKAEP